MKKDVVWSSYFEDEERFADFVNCFGCDGVQYVQQKDVLPEDSNGHYKVWGDVFSKMRDVVRRVAFGVNFCIIGILCTSLFITDSNRPSKFNICLNPSIGKLILLLAIKSLFLLL